MASVNNKVGSWDATFDSVLSTMQEDTYWINFFVRPCGPPPLEKEALDSLGKLRGQICARADFDESQKKQLLALIDAREAWYKRFPFCRG